MKKIAFCIVLMLFCFFISSNIDKKFQPVIIEDLFYLPSGNFLKGAALGFDEILADFLWIKALSYFGEHASTDQNYSWLSHILDIVTTLDPFYQIPYEFGGVILTTELNDVEKSTLLLKKGMKNISTSHPRYWYFPFFIAFNYMYHKNDYITAAHYLEQAAKFPESPAYIPLLVSRLYADADSPEIAVAFLKEMIKSTDKPELKTKLTQRLNEIINTNNIKFLGQAVDQFISKFYRYPNNLGELIEKGMINSVPFDPRGGRYYISREDHLVRNTKKSKNLKVHIDKSPKSILNMVPAE
ncbi:hypothetical protein [Desulfospira joergensenii]|uniref:hypothetical protein n=1 Tax=Desulfospira joergensenii TaxID=53329 RepID=UPI0003B6C785|nr:hypothetical protein [Desulfospira joergensenii]